MPREFGASVKNKKRNKQFSKNIMKRIAYLLITTVFLISCHSRSSEALYAAANFEESTDKVANEENLPVTSERKLIKNGTISLEVKDIKTEKIKVDSLIKKYKAYFEKETTNRYGNSTILTLKIRIPSQDFEKFIVGIEKGGNKITNKEISTEDVTEEYIDLETRLLNKRKFMGRYQELLKSAKNIKEMLEIQEKIRILEEEIESATGRLKYISNQVIYSTLELRLEQENDFKYVPEKRDSTYEKLKQSIIGGWFVFVDFLYILLYNWVFIIFISIGIFMFRKYRKKRKEKLKQSPNT
jgi:hypothetical protein